MRARTIPCSAYGLHALRALVRDGSLANGLRCSPTNMPLLCPGHPASARPSKGTGRRCLPSGSLTLP